MLKELSENEILNTSGGTENNISEKTNAILMCAILGTIGLAAGLIYLYANKKSESPQINSASPRIDVLHKDLQYAKSLEKEGRFVLAAQTLKGVVESEHFNSLPIVKRLSLLAHMHDQFDKFVGNRIRPIDPKVPNASEFNVLARDTYFKASKQGYEKLVEAPEMGNKVLFDSHCSNYKRLLRSATIK